MRRPKPGPPEAAAGPDTAGLSARAEEAERAAFELAHERAQTGTIARELELRALAVQHRSAYTEFTQAIEKAAAAAQVRGWPSGRAFLRTHGKADAHLLGMIRSPVARWYIREVMRSPVLSKRLLRPGVVGDEARAHLLDYVEEHGLGPALEALWRQIGGQDQEPLSA